MKTLRTLYTFSLFYNTSNCITHENSNKKFIKIFVTVTIYNDKNYYYIKEFKFELISYNFTTYMNDTEITKKTFAFFVIYYVKNELIYMGIYITPLYLYAIPWCALWP